MKKLIRVALLAIGVTLLVLAYQEYDRTSSKIARAFKQSSSQKLLIYVIGGGVCAGIGAFGILRK